MDWWPGTPKPSLKQVSSQKGSQAVAASHADLGERDLYCEGDIPLLFTENETNTERLPQQHSDARFLTPGKVNGRVPR
jgi:hypothetical protein